jgi:hypothetical protein
MGVRLDLSLGKRKWNEGVQKRSAVKGIWLEKGNCRKLHDDEHHDLYTSPSITLTYLLHRVEPFLRS